jgi:hypothetical protein
LGGVDEEGGRCEHHAELAEARMRADEGEVAGGRCGGADGRRRR